MDMKPRTTAAADALTIKNPSNWTGYSLAVELHAFIERPATQARHGVIRAFDPTSVFTGDRKLEHFRSVEDLVKIWTVVRDRRDPH
jgi:hypothetical protein